MKNSLPCEASEFETLRASTARAMIVQNGVGDSELRVISMFSQRAEEATIQVRFDCAVFGIVLH